MPSTATVERLRAAAAAVDAPAPETSGPGSGDDGATARTDPSAEAVRFEELHAALVAVLDRTAEDTGPADPARRT